MRISSVTSVECDDRNAKVVDRKWFIVPVRPLLDYIVRHLQESPVISGLDIRVILGGKLIWMIND